MIQQSCQKQSKHMQSFFKILSLDEIDQIKKYDVLAAAKYQICYEQKNNQSPVKKVNTIYKVQICSNHLLLLPQSLQQPILGEKISYSWIIRKIIEQKIIQQNNNNNFSQIIEFHLQNISNQKQYDNSYLSHHQDKIIFKPLDLEQNKYFLQVLSSKSIIQEIEDLKIFYKPIQIKLTREKYKIYRALNIKNQNQVAIKAYSIDSQNKSQKNQMIKNRVFFLNKLRSSIIQTVQKVYVTKKNMYIVMNYYQHTMNHYLKYNEKIVYEIEGIKWIMRKLLETLCIIHMKKITHGRIAPNYILIKDLFKDSYSICLSGFGNCYYASEQIIGNPQNYSLNSSYKQGSINEFELKKKEDVLALGCIFKQMLNKLNQTSSMNFESSIKHSPRQQSIKQVYQLLNQMINQNIHLRISAQQALNHPILTKTTHI